MPFIRNPRIDNLLKHGDVEEALQEPISDNNSSTRGVAAFVMSRQSKPGIDFPDDLAFAGLTLGEFLYDYIRIDPTVVKGVAFARAADVDGVLSFARFAETKADLSGVSLDGLHAQLQGYVAEHLVAHHLIAHGHDVWFPRVANNAGWDLMVDGRPFQVKCIADPSAVLEHMHRYPKIPVIVNGEMASQLGHRAGVYVDPELHHDAVRRTTEEALAGCGKRERGKLRNKA
jgi:hypothetical protein